MKRYRIYANGGIYDRETKKLVARADVSASVAAYAAKVRAGTAKPGDVGPRWKDETGETKKAAPPRKRTKKKTEPASTSSWIRTVRLY